MKTKINIILAVLTLCAITETKIFAQFDEGTKRIILTEKERTNLLQYAENSKAKLEKALADANGLDMDEKLTVYWKVMQEVVIDSYNNKPRSELLMRFSLNEAMDLTFGVPNLDGTSSPGALLGATNRGLNDMIIEDSIRMAISYYKDDRLAIEQGSLDTLPYSTFAQERLNKGIFWLGSVLENGYQYRASMTILKHWLNAMAADDHLVQNLFAEEIVEVDGILKGEQQLTASLIQNPSLLNGEVRHLRAVLEELKKATYSKNGQLMKMQEEKAKKEAEQAEAAKKDSEARAAATQNSIEIQKSAAQKAKVQQEQAREQKENDRKQKAAVTEANKAKIKAYYENEKSVVANLNLLYSHVEENSLKEMISKTSDQISSSLLSSRILEKVLKDMPVGVRDDSESSSFFVGLNKKYLSNELYELKGLDLGSTDLCGLFYALDLQINNIQENDFLGPDKINSERRMTLGLKPLFFSKLQKTYAWNETLGNANHEILKKLANAMFDRIAGVKK